MFTGTVSRVAHSLGRMEIEGAGAFSRMAAARLNLLYEREAAGNIASDVLGKLELTKGTVESGITFPVFALHAGASAWAQLHELARRCGFDLWADVDDKAHFRPCEGGGTHALTYGTDLLAWEHAALEPAADGVLVLGESPAGQGQSDDADLVADEEGGPGDRRRVVGPRGDGGGPGRAQQAAGGGRGEGVDANAGAHRPRPRDHAGPSRRPAGRRAAA